MSVFLEKEFRDAGYDVEVVHDAVLVIKNFISEKELDIVLNIIENSTEEDWNKVYKQNLKRFCMEKFGRDDVENLVAEGKFEITQGWDDKNLDVVKEPVTIELQTRLGRLLELADPSLELAGFGTLQRMQKGVELKSHTDQHTDPSIRYASILYINDDYKDGTLFFHNKPNSDLRPSPRTLLIFPGTEEFEHGVRHVGEGPIRYVTVGFIKVKNFYENNKY
ncbi:MAG: 2OG-Fe(II) oxygenase [Alphaproteobacteria bacterium]|nr:2OG-Fe(II) oxygenase [Alphaproteobacteria bacterium]